MNEIRNTYYEDLKDKSSTARGVYGRKGHSGKKSPKFPSDYLKKNEREALNGPVTTMDPHYFYTWEEFKELTPRLKVEYLNGLMERYHVGLDTIGHRVFDIQGHTVVANHMKLNGCFDQLKIPSKRSGPKTWKKLQEDIDKQRGIKIISSPTIPIPIPPVDILEEEEKEEFKEELSVAEEPKEKSSVAIEGFKEMSFSMKGFNFDFLKMIADSLPENVTVSISITTSE